MTRKYLFLALILIFAGYGGWVFTDSVTPYVGVGEAKTAKSRINLTAPII